MSSRYNICAASVYLGIVCLLLFLLPLGVHAQQMPVPASIQVPTILKILTFDRNFSQKIDSVLRIAIVYDPQDPASRQAQREIAGILDSLATRTIKQRPITYMLLEYSAEQTLEQIAIGKNVNVFYVMPGHLNDLRALLRVSRTHQITTVTGVPDYVKKGVAAGVGVKANRKPQILINLPASKSQGIAFDARLLRLSTVLK